MKMYVLELVGGKFDGSFKGERLLWGVYSSQSSALREMRSKNLKDLGDGAKCWSLERLIVDSKNLLPWMCYFSLDAKRLQYPPQGPKYSDMVPKGRCRSCEQSKTRCNRCSQRSCSTHINYYEMTCPCILDDKVKADVQQILRVNHLDWLCGKCMAWVAEITKRPDILEEIGHR